MQRMIWRLAAAFTVLATVVAFSMSGAGATMTRPTDHPAVQPKAVTLQDAHSKATSKQFLPINANVPVQVLTLGSKNGGSIDQSNNSTANSTAKNRSVTVQDGSAKPDSNEGWKDSRNERGSRANSGPKAFTAQDAHSKATSKQFLPINANVPVQVLTLGSKNGGSNDQSNNSTANSTAKNRSVTVQDGSNGGTKPQYQKGNGCEHERGSSDPAGSQAFTAQDAHSKATSVQIVPVNLNAPIQVLTLGSKNGGSNDQSNNSTANSTAKNRSATVQGGSGNPGWIDGGKDRGSRESGSQAFTAQDAHSKATSVQIVPVNVNAPIQVLTLGSQNGGSNNQSNNSTANSTASNGSFTGQGAPMLGVVPLDVVH